MVAIVSQKGKMFMGLINYLYEGKLEDRGANYKQAEVIVQSDNLRIPYGVEDQIGRKRLIEDFIDQAKAHKNYGDNTTKYVGEHILSFKGGEVDKIGKQKVKELCEQYIKDAGIDKTQYVAVSHGDTDIFHIHIVFNRSQNNRTLYPEWKEKMKAAERAVAISLKYGLELTGNQEKLAVTKGVYEARLKHQDIIDLQQNPLLKKARNLKHLEKMCEAQKISFSSDNNKIKVDGQAFQKRDLDIIFFMNRQEHSKTQHNKPIKTQEFVCNRKNNSKISAYKIKKNKIENKNDEWENKKVEDKNIDLPAIIIQNPREENQEFSHRKAWGNEDKQEKRYIKKRKKW